MCGGVARAAACLCVTLSHFCASLTNAAVHMLRTPFLDMHPHTYALSYIFFWWQWSPCSPPSCSQRILVAKLSHLRQQCRRGCRCNWSRSWSWSRRHLCAALACIFLPFEFVKSTSINLSSVRCFGSDSGSGPGSVALARHLHLRRLVLHARFHFGAAQIFR